MKGGFFYRIALLALVIFLPTALFAQQKFALVIGNGNYTNITKLTNPVNDANDMASALEKLGFSVEKILNGSLDQMEGASIRLKNRLSASRESYGFLFYAGHGIQSGGENYLIPADANIQSESFLRQRAVSVQALLDELNDAGNALNVVVLDACRDNPFSWKRSGSRGLSVVGYQPADSIVVYATSAGSSAADGSGRNGLFTGHLLNNLDTPGLEVTEVFRRTMGDVARDSGNAQRPAIYNQFSGVAYLGSSPQGAAPESAVSVAQAGPAAVQPSPQPLPSRSEKARQANPDAKLWTVGASLGSSFAAPWFIATARATLAPFSYSFLEIGLDAGFVSGESNVEYHSFYPFAHYAYYHPLDFGGWYAGAGFGFMISRYGFPGADVLPVNSFAAGLTAGLNLFDMLNISYTLRSNFTNASNKISVGYTYRFK